MVVHQKYQFSILLLIVFVSFIGISIPYPIFPPLFIHSGEGFQLFGEWTQHYRPLFLGIALAVYPLGQFLGGPIFGALSDRYGRKKILMLSLSGSVLGYLLTAVSLEIGSLWLLIASRFFTGVLESNLGLVRAMAADFEHIDRYKSLGGVNAASAIGYVLGPLLGGVLSDSKWSSWFSPKFPFYIALLLSVITLTLAYFLLHERSDRVQNKMTHPRPVWTYFNLVGRMRVLMKNTVLKYLLMISSILTLAVDIFYEFGPIYLTGRWMASPTGLAVYNGILSIALAFGNGWLSHRLSRSFPAEPIVKTSMLVTALILIGIVLMPSEALVLILFGIIGLSIAVSINTITVKISHVSDPAIQGEVMGTQFGLRMLGDALICLVGGVMIMTSWVLPLVMASIIALSAFGLYGVWLGNVKRNN